MKQPLIDFYGQYLDKFKEEYTNPQVDLLFEDYHKDGVKIRDKEIEFLEFFKAQFELFISNYSKIPIKATISTNVTANLRVYTTNKPYTLFNIFFKVEKVFRVGQVENNGYLKPYGYKFLAYFITYFDYINLNNEGIYPVDKKGEVVAKPFDFQEAFLVLKATERIWNPTESTN